MTNASIFALVSNTVRVLAAVVAMAGAARAEMTSGAAAITPVTTVKLDTAVSDASRIASRLGAEVVRVSGDSMLPYFGNGSVLVVRKAGFEALRAGAVAVYRNNFGDVVAHRVEAAANGGWTVRGANNRSADSTVVTADNFLGTVYVVFHSDAAAMIGADSIKVPVVYAMAAK